MAKPNRPLPSALIIDPQPHMAALVADMLRSIGYREIREATDARQAQLEFSRGPVGLIILDDAITGPDAVELVRRLRSSTDGPNRLVPVVMMAAAPDANRIGAARDAGVTEFLRKPFAASHLKARLDGLAAQPRPFIEAAAYAGPDRRRRALDIAADRRRQSRPVS